jgi:hypothetical protein
LSNHTNRPIGEGGEMTELFFHARWGEFYAFFAQGNPPLALQILGFNTIIFVLWIMRRMRNATALRSNTANLVQALLIGANALILFQRDIVYWLEKIT